METVVYDTLAEQGEVRFATFDVPEVEPEALRLSSLVAVRRAERVPAAERVPEDPLYVGEQLLTPSMGEPFSKAATKELPFYFVVYPAPAARRRRRCRCWAPARCWPRRRWSWPRRTRTGRIAQVSRIPIEALEPGTYELRSPSSRERRPPPTDSPSGSRP